MNSSKEKRNPPALLDQAHHVSFPNRIVLFSLRCVTCWLYLRMCFPTPLLPSSFVIFCTLRKATSLYHHLTTAVPRPSILLYIRSLGSRKVVRLFCPTSSPACKPNVISSLLFASCTLRGHPRGNSNSCSYRLEAQGSQIGRAHV